MKKKKVFGIPKVVSDPDKEEKRINMFEVEFSRFLAGKLAPGKH